MTIDPNYWESGEYVLLSNPPGHMVLSLKHKTLTLFENTADHEATVSEMLRRGVRVVEELPWDDV